MRIGNQTAFSAAAIMEPFEYAIARRFDAFEWFPDRRPDGRGWSDSDVSPAMRASIRQAARERDISLSVHGAWDASPLTAAGNERLLSQADFAADVGASIFVVHLFPAQGPEPFLKAITRLVARLVRHGIKLAIENTPETSAEDFNDLFRRLRCQKVPASSVGMCLDIGHANLCAGSWNDYLGYLDRLERETPIFHVHLHENRGDEDSHLTLFTGPAAVDAAGVEGVVDRLTRRRFSGCIILEQWPQPPALLDAARDRLEQIIAASPASRAEARSTSA